MTITTPPLMEPVTPAEAKAWLRVDWDDDDDMISTLITAARQNAEAYTNRAFISQGITEFFLPGDDVILSMGDVISVDTVTVDGVEIDAENYTTSLTHLGTVVEFTADVETQVMVVYTAGYGTEKNDVPRVVNAAILLAVADLYDNRTDKVRRLPTASENLLNKVRRWVT